MLHCNNGQPGEWPYVTIYDIFVRGLWTPVVPYVTIYDIFVRGLWTPGGAASWVLGSPGPNDVAELAWVAAVPDRHIATPAES